MEPFETARLLIRPFDLRDLEELYNLYNQEDLMLFIDGSARSYEMTKQYLLNYIADYERYGFGLCAVIKKLTGKMIGRCGLIPVPSEAGIEGELAFLFTKSEWGAGLATEFSQGMLRYAFEKLQLNRIFATVRIKNKASIRVLEKIGMQCVQSTPTDFIYEIRRSQYHA